MSEALRLAEDLRRQFMNDDHNFDTMIEASIELRRLSAELENVRKDAERWRFASWHIGLAWGEEGFTSLVRIVSEKHRALINEQVDDLMAGKMPATRAAMKGTP